MKLNIKKTFAVLGLATLLYSCDTTNESGYVPAVYTSPTTFTLTEDATAATDNSFVVTYTPSSAGKAYYAVVPQGTPAPSSTSVHSGSSSTFLQAGSMDVDNSTPVNFTIDTGIFGGYDYDVYAIHKSTDNFISETVTKLAVTTPDTAAPLFVRGNSSPAHNVRPGTNSPFTSVTFAFSEPVFYQGGDITFTGFLSGGKTVTVNNPAAISMSGTTVTITDHEFFSNDNVIVVAWADGTFKDKSGKNVAALSATTAVNYFFFTRDFSASEATEFLIADWSYQIFNSAFNPAVVSSTTGTWSVKKGTKPNTIILSNQIDHDLNAFVGADDGATQEFEVTVLDAGNPLSGGKSTGLLSIVPLKSGIGIDVYGDGTEAYWTGFYQNLVSPYTEGLAGFYNLDTGLMRLRVDFGSKGGSNDRANYFGDIDYIYNYVPGSGLLGKTANNNSTNSLDDVKSLPKGNLKTIIN